MLCFLLLVLGQGTLNLITLRILRILYFFTFGSGLGNSELNYTADTEDTVLYSEDIVNNVVKNLPSDKATAGEIPVHMLKISEFCFSELTKCINKAFKENKFADTQKLSDIVPVLKKLDPTDKTNLVQLVFYLYCLKCLKKLCMINFGFRKAHSTQHALFRLGRKSQTRLELQERLQWIYLRLMTVYCMI